MTSCFGLIWTSGLTNNHSTPSALCQKRLEQEVYRKPDELFLIRIKLLRKAIAIQTEHMEKTVQYKSGRITELLWVYIGPDAFIVMRRNENIKNLLMDQFNAVRVFLKVRKLIGIPSGLYRVYLCDQVEKPAVYIEEFKRRFIGIHYPFMTGKTASDFFPNRLQKLQMAFEHDGEIQIFLAHEVSVYRTFCIFTVCGEDVDRGILISVCSEQVLGVLRDSTDKLHTFPLLAGHLFFHHFSFYKFIL